MPANVPANARNAFEYVSGRFTALELVLDVALRNGGNLEAAVKFVRERVPPAADTHGEGYAEELDRLEKRSKFPVA